MLDTSVSTAVRSPNASSAARRASSGVMPAASSSRARRSRWSSISRSTSRRPVRSLAGTRKTRFISRLLWLRGGEHRAHHLRVVPPAARLVAERFSTGDGEAVELRFAVGVGQSPLFLEQAAPLEAMQRRVKRAFFEGELVVRRLADPPADGVAV